MPDPATLRDRVDMTIRLPNLKPAQAIALHAMFRLWQQCGAEGSSRMVAFMVDGDGDFRPKPEITFSADVYAGMSDEQKQHLWRIAQTSLPPGETPRSMEGRPEFDFDPVAWALRND